MSAMGSRMKTLMRFPVNVKKTPNTITSIPTTIGSARKRSCVLRTASYSSRGILLVS
jgi:hypothetical protein